VHQPGTFTLDLRRDILKKRDLLSLSKIKRLSKKVQENLLTLPPYSGARLPLLFYSFRSEVDTHPLIKRRLNVGEPVALPRTLVTQKKLECYLVESFEQLIPGAFSIMEPDPDRSQRVKPEKLDVVIVPGSVFDRRGGRFGYGGGFYDRFLSQDAPQAVRIALAFSFQVLDNGIPVAPHDQFMDYIVTEREVIVCNERKQKGQKRQKTGF